MPGCKAGAVIGGRLINWEECPTEYIWTDWGTLPLYVYSGVERIGDYC